MPDVEVILARERLASLEEAKALEAELRAEQAAFEKRLQGLPDGQTLNAYGARMEKLKKKSGLEGILSGAKELQEIHADLDRDMRNLRAMKEDLDKRRAELTQRILSLKDLVSEDIARLVEKYSLSDKGVGNITGLLLGPEWEMRIRKGLAVYRKLAPLLAKIPAGGETGKTEPEKRKRGEGLDRRFAETPPRPDFLIREARLSLHLSAGDLKGVLRNVTGQQALAGSPMTLELEGRPFSGADAVHMTAVFNRMRPASPEDRFRIGMEGWRPGTLGGGGLTLSAEKGVMEMDAVMGKGGLSGNMRMDLTGLHFVSVEVAGDAGPVLISALKDVRTLDVRVEMSGKPDQPVLRFSSSLDKVVKDAVSRIVRETAEAFRVRVDREVRMLSQEKFLEMDAGMRALAVVDSGLEERIAVVRRLAAKK